jgi:hypothetical protein
MAQILVALMAALPRQGEPQATVSCSSVDFFRYNSPVFDGPIVAEDWITSFDDLADALSCTDEQKVN